MGEATDSARAQVLAARGALDEELARLEASARAAVDVPAKVRRNPVKTAGLAAGAGFLVVGGPAKLFRRAKRAVLGPEEPLPKSMLPREIDDALKKLGTDGEKVRGTLEREFAQYLEESAPRRKERDPSAALALLLTTVGKPVAQRLAKQMASQLTNPDPRTWEDQLAKVRRRTSGPADPSSSDRTPGA